VCTNHFPEVEDGNTFTWLSQLKNHYFQPPGPTGTDLVEASSTDGLDWRRRGSCSEAIEAVWDCSTISPFGTAVCHITEKVQS
jgi:hypothetical protein